MPLGTPDACPCPFLDRISMFDRCGAVQSTPEIECALAEARARLEPAPSPCAASQAPFEAMLTPVDYEAVLRTKLALAAMMVPECTTLS